MKWYQKIPIYATIIGGIVSTSCVSDLEPKNLQGVVVNQPLYKQGGLLTDDSCMLSIRPYDEDRKKFNIKNGKVILAFGGKQADAIYLKVSVGDTVCIPLKFGDDPVSGLLKIKSLEEMLLNGHELQQ